MSEGDSGSLDKSSSGMLGQCDMSHRYAPTAILSYGERSLSDGAIHRVYMADARNAQIAAALSSVPARPL
jgi:hypothetical protein